MASNVDTMHHTATVWDHAVLARGVTAGLVGGGVVAALFLAFDWLEGMPLRTPAMLGSRFLINPSLVPNADLGLLVAVYTVVHEGAFIAIGAIAAFFAADIDATRSWTRMAEVSLGLFGVLGAAFVGAAALVYPAIVNELGWGRLALANLLAAGAMSAILVGTHTDPETVP